MTDDEIRDRTLRTKALQEMDTNSEIERFICDLQFLFKFSAERNDGMTTSHGPIYNSVNCSWDISRDQADRLTSKDRYDEWVNNNKSSRGDAMTFTTYQDVSGEVYIVCDTYYLIKYLDGDNCWLKNQYTINSDHYFDSLAELANSQRQLFVEPSAEERNIQLGNREIELSPEEPTVEKQSSLAKLVGDYISDDNVWVEAEFGSFENKDDSLEIPIRTDSGYTHTIRFTEPSSSRSPIWDLADEFNYDDPWNLEGERMYYTIHPLGQKQGYIHNCINISSDRHGISSDQKGIMDRLRQLF